MRRAAKRDTVERVIVEALRGVGATVHYISAPGVPDLLVGFRDVTYLLEVKTGKGEPTEAQQLFFSEWRGQAAIVRSVDDALRSIGAID
jgi:Holliday junction resolvase